MVNGMPRRTAAVEFALTVGPRARVDRVDVDTYRSAIPYLMISDGATEVMIRPHEDAPKGEAHSFFEELADVARAYADDLRTADDRTDR